MTNKLAKVQGGVPEDAASRFARLVDGWMADKTDATRAAYRAELDYFAKWADYDDPFRAAIDLFSIPAHEAYDVIDKFIADQLREGLSPATIRRRVAALRSLSKRAVSAGLAPAPLSNPTPRLQTPVTRMVSNGDWAKLLAYLRSQMEDPGSRAEFLARRDMAMLRLLRDVGLRRKEVVLLERVDFEKREIVTTPKGVRGARLEHPVDGSAWECLVDWCEIKPEVGPFFLMGHVSSLNKRLRDLSKRAGIGHVTPHMFRRAGITASVTHFGGYSREAVNYARHTNPNMTARYDKQTKDEATRRAQKQLGEDE